MKRNKLYFVLSLVILLTFALFAAACKKDLVADYAANMSESMNSVTEIEADAVITDSGVMVYEYRKTLTLTSEDVATETVSESKLTSNYALETTTDQQTLEKIKRSALLSVRLEKDLVESYSEEGNTLICILSKENTGTVLSAPNLTIADTAELKITVENKKLKEVTCSFLTESRKEVQITVTYRY